MSQYAAELCTLLVEDNFGELFGRIFSTLIRYDRLALARLKFYSRLSDKQLHYGLSAMIQMHLVFHYTSIDDGMTYYEANLQSAYYLVRSGKILEMIADRLGEYAATVMSTILYLGHAQVSYLETLPELVSEKPKDPQTNGVNGDHEHADHDEEGAEEDLDHMRNGSSIPNGDHTSDKLRLRLHSTLKALAAHGYIIRVREAQFHSPADNILDAERVIKSRSDVKLLKGKKLEEAILEGVERLITERTDGDLTRGLMARGIPRGVKRRHANGVTNGSSKRPRLDPSVTYAVAEGEDSEEDSLSEDDDDAEDTVPMQSDLIVRVNYEKLDVSFRNRRLVELAEQDSSAVTAQVYETLLRLIEYRTPRCRDQPEIPREGEEGERYSAAIPVYTLAEQVDPQLDLAGSIGPMDPSQQSRRGKRPLEDGVNGDGQDGPDGAQKGPNRTHDVDQHLTLLAQPPHNFCSRRITSGIPGWTVEYRHLARHLRHLEIERFVGTRHGSAALRILRILVAKGKLDEKRLQEISLMSPKDLRQVLGGMQSTGFVDLQEVPRDAQRQPSRTIYLWFYDPDRVSRTLLQDTYKAMSRCLQRLRFERNRLKEFLDKTERSDVKGNEDRYLSENELKTLHQWRDKEALLLGEVSRLDDLVAVLRDF